MKFLSNAKRWMAMCPSKAWVALLATLAGVLTPALSFAGEKDVVLKFSEGDKMYLYISLAIGILTVLGAFALRNAVLKNTPGGEKMQEVGKAIREGALAYLQQQVKLMLVFMVILAVGLFFLFDKNVLVPLCFIAGVAASYLAGYAGMLTAVDGNMRTAAAALTSYKKSLEIAFRSGAVAGLITVGLGLLGATLILLFGGSQAMILLVGFGFGGSLAALFMRVGGGIFTKAADVGADLVGKVEAGIPEDDPRNPATIADNVGDNVGDCAGMAADVFESYEVTLVAAIVLGAATSAIFDQATWMRLVLFALMARGIGIIASTIGIFLVKGSDDLDSDPLKPIQGGFRTSAVIAAIATLGLAYLMMGGTGEKISTIKLRGTNEDQIERIEKLIQARDSFASANGKKAWEVSAKDIKDAPELKDLKFDDMNPMTGQKMDKAQAIDQMLERLGSISSKDVERAKPEPMEGFSNVATTDLKSKQISFTSSSFVQPAGKTPSANETIDLAAAVEGKKLDLALVEIKLTTPASNGRPAETKSTWNGPVSAAFAKKRVADIEEQQKAQAKGQPMTKVEMGKTIDLTLMVDKRGKLVAAVEEKNLPKDFDFGAVNSQPVVSAPSYFPINSETYGKISKEIEELSKKGSLEGAPKLPPPAQIALVKLTRTEVPWYLFFIAITFGLFLAFVIEILTDYFVSTHKKPTKEVAGVSTAGPAPMIIQGFAYASESSVYMVFAIVLALLVPLFLFNPATYGSLILSFYGIALVGLGLLTTTGYVLAMDTFGPISDNAQGVYEMSGEGHDNVQGSKAVQRLDAAGNTTKALTKGFAIATAVVAAVALFHSYIEDAQLTGRGLPLDTPEIFLGFLVGGAAPYLFSAFSINAVGRASFQLINEVRRQFRNDPGILAGTSKPNYASCVAIVTAAAQKELLGPGILAIALPVAVAFGFAIGKPVTYVDGSAYCLVGAQALGGFLAGSILSGQLMAVLLANSGGMWDNAKKLIEDGLYGGKGTDAHKAAVVCDTVGDPFKDTAGPALNPLIKVMNLVALLLAPVIIRPFGNTTLVAVTVFAIGALAFAIYLSKKGSLADEMIKVAEEAAKVEKAKAIIGKKKITVDED